MKKKILVILCVSLMILTACSSKKEEGKSGNKSASDSFFLKNWTSEKYAIYGFDGTKKTDFIYSAKSDFVNGYALVKYLDDKKSAIVDTDGKEKIKKDEYQEIEHSGGTYLLKGKDGEKDKLVDSNLKVLKEGTGLRILTLPSTKYISIVADSSKVYVYSVNGKLLNEMDYNSLNSSVYLTENPVSQIASFIYNKKNYVVDLKNEKFVIAVDSDSSYNASLTNKKDRNSYVVFGNKDYFVVDGKITAEKEKGSVTVQDECIIYQHKTVLKANGETAIEFDNNNRISYYNADSYLKEVNGSSKIEVYSKGVLKTTINGKLYSTGLYGRTSKPYFKIRVGDKYSLVDKDGNILMTYDSIVSVSDNYVSVRDADQTVFVDFKNKEIARCNKNDKTVYLSGQFYLSEPNKLTRIKDKKSVDYSITSLLTVKMFGTEYIALKNTQTNKYALFDGKTASIKGEYDQPIILEKDYYKAGGKYYSYKNAKEFYDANASK